MVIEILNALMSGLGLFVSSSLFLPTQSWHAWTRVDSSLSYEFQEGLIPLRLKEYLPIGSVRHVKSIGELSLIWQLQKILT